jgi:hypothetical protein
VEIEGYSVVESLFIFINHKSHHITYCRGHRPKPEPLPLHFCTRYLNHFCNEHQATHPVCRQLQPVYRQLQPKSHARAGMFKQAHVHTWTRRRTCAFVNARAHTQASTIACTVMRSLLRRAKVLRCGDVAAAIGSAGVLQTNNVREYSARECVATNMAETVARLPCQ